jgi:hypothetical protein
MTIEQLRKAAYATPFRPFTVCLADGRQVRVRSPEYIWIPPEAQRTFHVASSGEDYRVIDLLLVTSIDFVNGYGARGRRRRA